MTKLNRLERFDVQFGYTVGAGLEGDLSKQLFYRASVESMVITFPVGSDFELQLHPYILKPDLRMVEFIDYVGNKYVTGNNQGKVYRPGIHFETGDTLVVHYKNTGADDHAFDVSFTMDPLYGSLRVDAGRAVNGRG